MRRDPGEAEESQAGAAEEGVGEADSSEARVSDEGGALGSSSSSDSPQQSQRRQGERPSLPSNPLEDESAAERWLEKVRLIERSEKNSAKSEEEASGEAAENAADDEARKEDAAAKEEMEDEIEESGLYERDETSARQALAEVDSSAPQEDGQRPRRRNEDGECVLLELEWLCVFTKGLLARLEAPAECVFLCTATTKRLLLRTRLQRRKTKPSLRRVRRMHGSWLPVSQPQWHVNYRQTRFSFRLWR